MGYVYVIENADSGFCKIGFSEHPDVRLKTLQTYCPCEISRRWLSSNIPNAYDCEQLLHKMFAKNKGHGEWFKEEYSRITVIADAVTKAMNNENIARNLNYVSLIQENDRLKLKNKSLSAENTRLVKKVNELTTILDDFLIAAKKCLEK